MKKIVVSLLSMIILGAFASVCLADLVALDDKSFVVVERPDSESERISYYKVVNGQLQLHDLIVVRYSFDQRITTRSRDIYIKVDKPAREYFLKP